MKFGKQGEDYSKRFWEAGRIGAWFGAWEIQDLYASYEAYRPKRNDQVTKREIADYLNKVLVQRGLPAHVSATDAGMAQSFDELPKDTWMLAYFDRTLHLGQLAESETHDGPTHFDVRSDRVKTKMIKNQKSFPLNELPEAFLLLASSGQATLHKLPGSATLVQMLVEEADAEGVLRRIRALTLREWVDGLGPKGWESICSAYLILRYGFLPTGLLIGGTLADYDVVGRTMSGTKIYAQCKKSPGRHRPSTADVNAFSRLPGAQKFFFAYNDVIGPRIPDVNHVSGEDVFQWLEADDIGKQYASILR